MNTLVHRPYLTAIIAFLTGILVMGVVTSRTGSKSTATHSEREESHEHEHEEEGLIKLSPEAIKTAGITVQSVSYQLSSDELSVSGVVEAHPSHRAKISPSVAGKIVSVSAKIGDSVRRGQVLAVMQSAEVAQSHAAVNDAQSSLEQAVATVDSAKSSLLVAQVRLRNAEVALKQQTALARTGAFSQPSVQAAQSDLSDAQSELIQARTELQSHTQAYERAEKLYASELISKNELEQMHLERRQDESKVERAEARVSVLKQTLEREKKVYQGGMLNKQALQSAEAERRTATADVVQADSDLRSAQTAERGARSRLVSARDNLIALEGGGHAGGNGRIALMAPINGTITEAHATVGEAVERSAEIFEIENLATVLVVASVPEGIVNTVRKGLPVSVRVASFPGRQFAGVVQTISSKLNEKNRTLPVFCVVENVNRLLKPEMFATVGLSSTQRSPMLVVPSSAVIQDEGKNFVFVQSSGGFELRSIVVGNVNESHTEVISGLKNDDLVAVTGVIVLKSENAKDELKGHEH